MTLADIEALKPEQRLAFVRENAHYLETYTETQLVRVGTLLCHASDEEMRREHPIIGDAKTSEQSRFDEELFGDGYDKPGNYAALPGMEESKGDDK